MDPQGRQFECVVDNQVLAEVLNGRAAIGVSRKSQGAQATPIAQECAVIISKLFERGWTPRYEMCDVVRWRCRALNKTADLAGRYVVARAQSFTISAPNFAETLSETQWVQIHTDGGKERDGASASLTILIWSGIPHAPQTFPGLCESRICAGTSHPFPC